MRRRTVQLLSALSAVVLVGLMAAPLPASAVTVSGKCPTAATDSPTSGTFLPPYPAGTTITDLVGCTTPFTAPGDTTMDVHLTYGDLGLVADSCSTVTALSVTSTGTPDGEGWGIVAYNNATNAVVPPAAAGNDGFYQQFNAAAGAQLPTGGATFLSPSAQPASGSYTITGALDPTAISLADLAAGHLSVTVVVLNSAGPDTLASVTISATTDSSACPTTTTAPGTSIAPTTTAKAAAVVVAPHFTG